MSVESNPAKTYSTSEQANQRLLLREHRAERQPGDGWRSALYHIGVGGVATVTDLAESHLVDKLIRDHFREKVTTATETSQKAVDAFDEAAFKAAHAAITDEKKMADAIKSAKDTLFNPARIVQGKKFGLEFVEEGITDTVYGMMANAWVRKMTGKDDAKYVSETASFIGEWFVKWSQVFNGNAIYPKKYRDSEKPKEAQRGWFKIKKAYEAADFVNPVNVEAAFRLIEEVPVVGDGVAWLHEKSDKILSTAAARFANMTAGWGILGYHIGRNVQSL